MDETPYPQFIGLVNSLHGKNMAAYLSFMSVRLLEIRRVLKDTGSGIYLHCDPTASQLFEAVDWMGYLVMRISGMKSCGVSTVGGTGKRYFSKKHDILLFYSKTNRYCH